MKTRITTAVGYVSVILCITMQLSFTNSHNSSQHNYIQKAGMDTIPPGDDEKIFTAVDIEATFPGGDDAWRNYLENNLDPTVAANYGAPAGAYTVVIQFVVDKEGKITDIKPLTHHGYGMEAEVIRLLKKAPLWNPASQNGRPVKAYRKQPVTFQVSKGKKRKKDD